MAERVAQALLSRAEVVAVQVGTQVPGAWAERIL
jgi:hypothetical protein